MCPASPFPDSLRTLKATLQITDLPLIQQDQLLLMFLPKCYTAWISEHMYSQVCGTSPNEQLWVSGLLYFQLFILTSKCHIHLSFTHPPTALNLKTHFWDLKGGLLTRNALPHTHMVPNKGLHRFQGI